MTLNFSCSSDETIERVFSSTGFLSEAVADYEMRKEQKEMSLRVMDAYVHNRILLVEAATGVGKSFAYLVPALLWAAAKKGPTVISTHTIALQEQLIKKDIPFLLKVLNLDLQVTLVKGMGNYFCFKKYDEVVEEKSNLSPGEQIEIEKLGQFAEGSYEGSSSQVNFPLSPGVWEKVAAERHSCTHVNCPYFKNCFFFKARKQLAEAQILIVNHHLLVADLSARLRPDFEEEKSILPKYSRLVIDEAHHLEDIALESFSVKIDREGVFHHLRRVHSDFQPQKSLIGFFKEALVERKKQLDPKVVHLLDVEIPVQKRRAEVIFDQLLDAIQEFCEGELSQDLSLEGKDSRWRLSQEKLTLEKWTSGIDAKYSLVEEEWKKLFSLFSLLKIGALGESSSEEKETFNSHLASFEMVETILEQKLSELQEFTRASLQEKRARWVESSAKNLVLVEAKLNIAEYLRKLLFLSKETVLLCSATLTTNRNFSFLRQQIGLHGGEFVDRVEEKSYDSPFDFHKCSLFLVPREFPFPHEPDFFNRVVGFIRKIIETSKGGCFLLFTSYEMLQSCYEKIVNSSDAPKCSYLKQGDAPRHALIERFKEREDNVLFATSSFWEGIDIPGNALRCVILVKLPFRVPSEPLFQAMSEMYEKEGKDPFSQYSLPYACLRFKQGFGRLIRTKNDRGCVVCLDKRVMTKSYGKAFLKSLPPCPGLYGSEEQIIEEMGKFYDQK